MFFIMGDIIVKIGITDVWKLVLVVALMGAHDEECKALMRTILIGPIITAATFIPLISLLIWP